jgi:hypothetical protein
VLPFTESNNLKTKHLHLWIRGRRAIEQHQELTMRINNHSACFVDVVDCPSLSDVVFKTGSSNLSHPGNSGFHEMLRSLPDDSQILVVSPETLRMIFENVTSKKGRFLEWDSCGYWRVMSDPDAIRQKIYSCFLYAKKSSNARRSRQNNSSSTFLFESHDGKKRKIDGGESEISSCVERCRY